MCTNMYEFLIPDLIPDYQLALVLPQDPSLNPYPRTKPFKCRAKPLWVVKWCRDGQDETQNYCIYMQGFTL